MVQSTINVLQRGKNTLRRQSTRYVKYLSKNARYTNHLIAFWIKVIDNALEACGFDVVVVVRIAVAVGRDVRTTAACCNCRGVLLVVRIDCDTGGDVIGRLCNNPPSGAFLPTARSAVFICANALAASVTAFWMFASALACAAWSARDGRPTFFVDAVWESIGMCGSALSFVSWASLVVVGPNFARLIFRKRKNHEMDPYSVDDD
jgi:hypothetical protein